MGWITASTELNDNQTQIRGSDASGPSVLGDQTCINWSQLDTKTIYVATIFSLSLYFFNPFLREDLSHYIAPFESSSSYNCWSSEPSLE